MIRLLLQILVFVAFEAFNFYQLTQLVYSFLLAKRNEKGAKKIHNQQSKKDRFTLSYVKNYTIYPRQCNRFYKIRLFYIAFLIPKYTILTVALIRFDAFWLADLMLAVKILFIFLIQAFFFKNKLSIYDKRNYKNSKQSNLSQK